MQLSSGDIGKRDIDGMKKNGQAYRTWGLGILSCVLIAYLVFAALFTSQASSSRMCTGVRIAVHDTARLKFVTAAELAMELGDLPSTAHTRRLCTINLDSIERLLSGIDKIESVSVNTLTDGRVLIDVWPMQPVARIFDDFDGTSYYINRSGKRILADARYHLNVPVVHGCFKDSSFTPRDILPLVDYISSDSSWCDAVSMIKVDSPRDVILVPVIRGHVINLGSPDNLHDKLRRIQAMYTKVLSVKGWEFYDTLSVKWRGQVVATRRDKSLPPPLYDDVEDEEEVSISTMMAGQNVAPGQTLPGVAAHDDKPIPGKFAPEKPKAPAPDSLNKQKNPKHT